MFVEIGRSLRNTKSGDCAINELILTGNRFVRLLVLSAAPLRE
jgi:hypothetical protein